MKEQGLILSEDDKQKMAIMNLMKMFNGMVDTMRNRNLECVDLTSRQMDVIFYLIFHKDQQITQADIERKFHMSNPTVTGILNRLESKGFITRTAGQKDKRVKIIQITDRVWEIHDRVSEQHKKIDKVVFEDVSGKEMEQLFSVLHKMCVNLSGYLGKDEDNMAEFFCEALRDPSG